MLNGENEICFNELKIEDENLNESFQTIQNTKKLIELFDQYGLRKKILHVSKMRDQIWIRWQLLWN